MGLLDSIKGMFSGKKGDETKAQAEKIAQQVDDEAAKLSEALLETSPARRTR
jgi:hypothetical protein